MFILKICDVKDIQSIGLDQVSNKCLFYLKVACSEYQKYTEQCRKYKDIEIAFSNFIEIYKEETGWNCKAIIKEGKLLFITPNSSFKGLVDEVYNLTLLSRSFTNVSTNQEIQPTD